MEIIPGEGLPDVRIGARRADVVAAVGEPVTDGGVAWYHDAHPPFSVHYDADDVVEYVEVAHGAGRGSRRRGCRHRPDLVLARRRVTAGVSRSVGAADLR
ncbi:hypothetical protein [Oryzobacter telluris]|uniref:hypothetical protein n=1 Tax=Oryzobacter telluris TaxID=3149179 RepID=UPI00370D6783